MKAKIENFVAWFIMYVLLAFGFVLFRVFWGRKMNTKEMFALMNKRIVQWSKKHYWFMYFFGMLLFFSGTIGALALGAWLTVWGVHFMLVALSVGLCGAMMILGLWEILSSINEIA